MKKTIKITNEIKEEVETIVDMFNKKNKSNFLVRYKGRFLYLDKVNKKWFSKTVTKVGRLEFNGNMKNWSFAVFKYSSERYDPDEWFFPGRSELDGTIESALRAGLDIHTLK